MFQRNSVKHDQQVDNSFSKVAHQYLVECLFCICIRKKINQSVQLMISMCPTWIRFQGLKCNIDFTCCLSLNICIIFITTYIRILILMRTSYLAIGGYNFLIWRWPNLPRFNNTWCVHIINFSYRFLQFLS